MSTSHRQSSPFENADLATVVAYMQSHWPSHVKPEWQVTLTEYPDLVKQAVADLSQNVTRNRNLIRVAGISGSGKTTQILPAVDAYCETHDIHPALLAARQFVKYHPHYQKIFDFYGEENLRKMTDEFTTIMLFMSLATMIHAGFDIILDVTLLDPKMEAILTKFLTQAHYNLMILMVATSPTVTEKFLSDRAWRHTSETEQEFIRSTEKALQFYAENAPDTHIIIWSVYHEAPEFDGPVSNCLQTFRDFSQKTELPKPDDEARKAAKIAYLRQI